MIEMTEKQVDALLNQARIGRLCMAGPDGRPYALPIPFCWADGSVYVRLPLTGRKGEILSVNPLVCFEVDEFTDCLDHYASVLVEGRLVEVTSHEEKGRIKVRNDEKYDRLRGGYRPGHGRRTPLEALPMRKIIVERISGRSKEPAAQRQGVLV